MYKRLTLEQLLGIQSGFFQRLQGVIKWERCQLLKEFLRAVTKDGDDIYYMREGNGYFRISKKWEESFIFTDEVEKIEVAVWPEELNKIHNLLKWDKKVQKIMKDNQSIKDTLEKEFEAGERRTFMDKPYIVYDLETIWTTNDLKSHEISVGYMFDSTTGVYKLIEKANAQKVVDHMLDFDWWIVWFYSLWFDNPVILHNTEFDQAKLDILNQKSVDILFFVQKMLGRRMWLNKLAEALVWVKKSLESWVEWSKMYKDYLVTWDKKLLEAVKRYCKNDVKMTLLLFLYLLKYKKLYDEGEEITFTDDDILKYGQLIEEDAVAPTWQQSMF